MGKQLDLLIVKPADYKNIYGKLKSPFAAIEPPLWSGLIAAYVRQQGYSVKIIDAEAECLSPEDVAQQASNLEPILVVFTVTGNNLSASTWLMTGSRDYILALKNKAPDIKRLLWGLHPSALPARTLKEEHVDFVCQGEGFFTLVELINRLKNRVETKKFDIAGLWYIDNGLVKSNPPAPLIKNLDDLPSVAWDLLPMKKYRAHNWLCFHDLNSRDSYGVIYSSLGCPFNCYFCNLNALFGGRPSIRYRSPQKVIQDIDILVMDYQIKNIKVLDECFVLNEKHVLDICNLIIQRKYKLNIWAYARIDTVNERMLKKMKQAGFNWLCYGIESASKEVLSEISRKTYTQDDIKQVIRMTKDSGINVLGNFMFGLPDDDLQTMQMTLDLAKELNCEYTNFYATVAYPGSHLYEDALRNNVKLPDTWRGYAAYSKDALPLPTKYLSGKEVLEFRDKAFFEFYSNQKYIEMIDKKFGSETAAHIKNMLSHKIDREVLNKKEDG